MEMSKDFIKMSLLKNAPFFETEVSGQVKIKINDIKKVGIHSTGMGSAADPSYTVGFYLKNGKFLNTTFPFKMSVEVENIIILLESKLKNINFDIDENLEPMK